MAMEATMSVQPVTGAWQKRQIAESPSRKAFR